MSRPIRIAVCVVLALAAVYFGDGFRRQYTKFMSYEEPAAPASLEDLKLPGEARLNRSSAPETRFGFYAAAFFGTVVILGLLVAHEVSQILGQRALKLLYHEDQITTDHSYDRAEQEWANGNHLEAIRLMRDYLAENPREQHVALRIAEIYEKDLHNPLAAALEYEEVLQQKLSPERWGWAAIHLCNLYYRLKHPDKAVVLLRRIDAEYGSTAAAAKARKRLAMIEADEAEPPETVEDESKPEA